MPDRNSSSPSPRPHQPLSPGASRELAALREEIDRCKEHLQDVLARVGGNHEQLAGLLTTVQTNLQGLMSSVPSAAAAARSEHSDPQPFLLRFKNRNEEIDRSYQPLIDAFRDDVLALQGRNFGSLEANQQIAEAVQETANRLFVEYLCPHCRTPARFKCAKAGNAKYGAFSFGHSGSTHGATTTIPKLIPVPKNTEQDGRKRRVKKSLKKE